MKKLYLFGIGGTGARVIRSFTMLMAAGVNCGADRVIPVFIDLDKTNGDLTRTVDILNKYCDIRGHKRGGVEVLNFIEDSRKTNRFFKTKIDEPRVLDIKLEKGHEKFGAFIRKSALLPGSSGSDALVDLLYTKDNLDLTLDVGTKGHPNIGCIVLNQFKELELDKLFTGTGFSAGDKIFIVSSIFGGTGSAGFPLLLKTLREKRDKKSEAESKKGDDGKSEELKIPDLVRKACMGAIAVMPYFNVSKGSDIDSRTFVNKTIAAMDYYQRDIIGEKGSDTSMCIDHLYSIADYDRPKSYDYHVGKEEQKNEAHFVELASALAICDFMDKRENSGEGNTHITQKYRFGVESEGILTFKTLTKGTIDVLRKPFTQLWLFARYFLGDKEEYIKDKPFEVRGEREERFLALPAGNAFKEDGKFFDKDSFYHKLKVFMMHFCDLKDDVINAKGEKELVYVDYIHELKDSFLPYSLDKSKNDIFDRITGLESKMKNPFTPNITGWNLLETKVNKHRRDVMKNLSGEERLLEFFWRGTRDALEKRDW